MRVIDWLNKPRDPKVDPIRGDILKKGGIVRSVSGVVTNWRGIVVVCHDMARDDFRSVRPRIHEFRKWAATAEVHTVAPEPK